MHTQAKSWQSFVQDEEQLERLKAEQANIDATDGPEPVSAMIPLTTAPEAATPQLLRSSSL